MKVTTDTPDLLIVDDKPIILGIALIIFILVFAGAGLAVLLSGEWFGLIFLVVGCGLGFAAFAVFVRRVQVVFHRPEGYVEFRRRNVFGGKSERLALADVARADIEESRSSDNGATWRVVLVVTEGRITRREPVTMAFSNGRGHHRVAAAINHWLDAAATGDSLHR